MVQLTKSWIDFSIKCICWPQLKSRKPFKSVMTGQRMYTFNEVYENICATTKKKELLENTHGFWPNRWRLVSPFLDTYTELSQNVVCLNCLHRDA